MANSELENIKNIWKSSIKNRDKEKFSFLFNKAEHCLGKKVAEQLFKDVLSEIDGKSARWLLASFSSQEKMEQMERQAYHIIFQHLNDAGFVLGQDFSIAPEGEIYLSDEVKQFLKNSGWNPD